MDFSLYVYVSRRLCVACDHMVGRDMCEDSDSFISMVADDG